MGGSKKGERAIVTPDRKLLEGVILPWVVAQKAFRRVLWVGCCPHTVPYYRPFGRRLDTIDIDPEVARYGLRGRHVVDSVVNLGRHFDPGHFDVIFLNGILGFGVNDAATAERMLKACVTGLRVGGLLVLGWNDLPEHKDFHPYDLKSIGRLRPVELACLGTSMVQVTFRAPVREGVWSHTYDFLERVR